MRKTSMVRYGIWSAVCAFVSLVQVADAAQAPRSVRLYVFDCGKLDIPDITPYKMTREELQTNVMSVPCFLVVHPNGTLMWDVGAVPDALIPENGTGIGARPYATSTKRLETQLGEAGYKPSD